MPDGYLFLSLSTGYKTKSMKKVLLFILLFTNTLSYAQASDWLSKLSNEVPVCQLSVPGVHDACTGCGWVTPLSSSYSRKFNPSEAELKIYGDRFVRTQEYALSELWHKGIRAFDLRPAVVDKELRICHGPFRTAMTLRHALQLLTDSLTAHPGEMAFIVMQHEAQGDDLHQGGRWNKMVSKLLGSLYQKGILCNFFPNMKLGDARGKILLFCRDRYALQPFGAYIDHWYFDADIDNQKRAIIVGRSDSCRVLIQDYYDLTAPGALDTKVKALININRLRAKAQQQVWSINHTSGFALHDIFNGEPFCSSKGYRKNASVTNQAMSDYLRKISTDIPTGFIMMDYAGTDHSQGYDVMGMSLINEIIHHNDKYK